MRQRTLCAVAIAVLSVAACKPTVKNTKEEPVHQQNEQRYRPDFGALISAAERLRDRDFSGPPTLQGVRELSTRVDNWGPGPRQDIEILRETLFSGGQEGPGPRRTAPNHIAQYSPDKHVIEYLQDHSDTTQVDQAILFSLVQALDRNHLKPIQSHPTLDQAIGHHSRSLGPAIFVTAAYEAQRIQPKITLDMLADRPDVLDQLDSLDWIIKAANDDNSKDDTNDRFAIRQGFALTAALFRSGGWSAVEWLHHQAIPSTQTIVRPDRWLAGNDIGSWDWPEENRQTLEDRGWTLVRQSRVGPATIGSWQQRFVGAEASSTLYNHWRGGSFRYWTTPQGSWIWQWLTQWDTPSSSKEVAAAFRRSLESTSEPECTIDEDGLRLIVICTNNVNPQILENQIRALHRARIRYTPRTPELFSFRKADFDRYLDRATSTGLKDSRWTDSTFSHDLELTPHWSVVESQALPVRWLATHEDGSQLLLSVDLTDPLGSDFGSEAYRRAVTQAISSTSSNFKYISSSHQPDAAIEYWQIRFRLINKGLDQEVTVWQFNLGDEIVSLSLQSSPSTMERHLPASRSIVTSLRPNPSENLKPAPSAGSIEILETTR